jgi:hypothetical protein
VSPSEDDIRKECIWHAIEVLATHSRQLRSLREALVKDADGYLTGEEAKAIWQRVN